MRDGKSKFYRTLNFDKDTWKVIKDYNKIKEEMKKDIENKKEKEDENI